MPRPKRSSTLTRELYPGPVMQRTEPARKRLNVTLLPGDGIGPEVVDAAVRAIEATGVSIEWDRVELNPAAILKAGGCLPPPVIESIRRSKVALKGPVTTPVGEGYQSANLKLRREFNLFANYRPVRTIPSLLTRFSDVEIDLVLFRENTESLYSGIEHEVCEGVTECIKVITRKASLRIARSAFDFALLERRHKVTAIHKANILKLTDGLFLQCCREVAAMYPTLRYEEMIVDNAAMQLVTHPERFDVIVAPNLYGDILSDLAAGLVGGLGLIPGANLGANYAVFEAVHGSAPDIAGMGMANPTALFRAGALLLQHLGERSAASRLDAAIDAVYGGKHHLTCDVGGTSNTATFTQAVVSNLRRLN